MPDLTKEDLDDITRVMVRVLVRISIRRALKNLLLEEKSEPPTEDMRGEGRSVEGSK